MDDLAFVPQRVSNESLAALTVDTQSVLKRIAELENAISKALRHAEKNGMKDWPVFLNLRKVYNARKEDTNS